MSLNSHGRALLESYAGESGAGISCSEGQERRCRDALSPSCPDHVQFAMFWQVQTDSAALPHSCSFPCVPQAGVLFALCFPDFWPGCGFVPRCSPRKAPLQ